jgi:hypothetical protein
LIAISDELNNFPSHPDFCGKTTKKQKNISVLEPLGCAAATRAFFFVRVGRFLAVDVRGSAGALGARGRAKVTFSFTGFLGTTEKEGVFALGSTEGKLIKRQAFTASLEDAGTSAFGETESADGHFGDFEDTVVVGDGGNGNNDFVLIVGRVAHDAANRQRRAVDARGAETFEDGFVEWSISAASQKFVEFDEKSHVDVVGLRILAVGPLDTATSTIEVNAKAQIGFLHTTKAGVVQIWVDWLKITHKRTVGSVSRFLGREIWCVCCPPNSGIGNRDSVKPLERGMTSLGAPRTPKKSSCTGLLTLSFHSTQTGKL